MRGMLCGACDVVSFIAREWPSGGRVVRWLLSRLCAALRRSTEGGTSAVEADEHLGLHPSAVLVEVASCRGGGCRARPLERECGGRERDKERQGGRAHLVVI